MSRKTSMYLAEGIGTFILVLIGVGAVIVNTLDYGGISLIGIAAAFGLVVMTMVYAIGPISGAHLNPAITFALYLAKKIDQPTAIGYIISQLVGATIAGYVLLTLFPQTVATIHLGTTSLGPTVVPLTGLMIETLITFILIFVVLVMTTKENHHAGLAIGAAVAFNHLFAISLTGASMNPARTFGPAIASGYFSDHLVYWVGPFLGATLAYLAWKQISKVS